MRRTVFVVLILVISISFSFARDIKPSAVLVRLSTSQRKTEYFLATNNQKKLTLLKEDLDAISIVTRNDFGDHFNLCPVYYFYDTNYNKVLKGDFAGVLLDSSLHTLQSVPAFKNGVLIAYFGTKPSFRKVKSGDSVILKPIISNASSVGLVVLDDKGELKHRDFPYFIGRQTYKTKIPLTLEVKYLEKKYNYSSPNFELDYLQVADALQEELKDYYGLSQ